MKRSFTDDTRANNCKKHRSHLNEKEPDVQSFQQKDQPSSANNDMSALVLNYVRDIVRDLDQGHLDHCLSKQLDRDTLDKLQPEEVDMATALDTALKNIAQKQLMLETDNLRYRIAIQQQYQLLTASQCESSEDITAKTPPATSTATAAANTIIPSSSLASSASASNNQEHDITATEMPPPTPTTTTSTETNTKIGNPTTTAAMATPEHGISTIRDSSMLEKMQPHNRSPMLSMPTSNTVSPTGYFGKIEMGKSIIFPLNFLLSYDLFS